jgi:hypothetical protein
MEDDPTLPCFTLRVFVVGIVSIKCLFYINYPLFFFNADFVIKLGTGMSKLISLSIDGV